MSHIKFDFGSYNKQPIGSSKQLASFSKIDPLIQVGYHNNAYLSPHHSPNLLAAKHPFPQHKATSSKAVLGGFRASPQLGDFTLSTQLMNLKIKEESTASRHKESSYASPEDFKDGSSYDSRYFSKSLGGHSNTGSKQSEHRLKEKRSIFRAFKSFYGKGIYLDPESHMKRYRYYTKNKLNEYDLSHSTLFNNYIELFS